MAAKIYLVNYKIVTVPDIGRKGRILPKLSKNDVKTQFLMDPDSFVVKNLSKTLKLRC
jgi:hypothetical protein